MQRLTIKTEDEMRMADHLSSEEIMPVYDYFGTWSVYSNGKWWSLYCGEWR